MAVNYTQYSFQLYGYLMQLRQTLEPMADDPQIAAWIDQIDEQQNRITTRKFQVAVLGEFKRGKSSFINTLLGREILPADALPTTATINRVVYGDHPRALLRMKDGQTQAVSIDELGAYVTKLNSEAEANAARIEEAIVEYPSMFCRNDVELIDTPGFNDDDRMTQVAISRLNQVDLAIVAISAAYPFSETETELVTQLIETPHISRILFVVTMMDKLDEEDRDRMLDFLRKRIADKVRQRLSERHSEGDPVFDKYNNTFADLRIYGLSSTYALRALKTNDMALFEKSGYQLLNQELPPLLVAEQAGGTIRSTLGVLQQIAYDFSAWPNKRRAALQDRAAKVAGLKPVFAQKIYSSLAEERRAWEVACADCLDEINRRIEACSQEYAGVWENAQGTETDRVAAVISCMADQFRRINQYLLAGHPARLRSAMHKASQELNRALTDDLKASLSDLPQFKALAEPLMKELAQTLAWPEDISAPVLFYWSKYPLMEDIITPNGLNADCPAADHPYVRRSIGALRVCAEKCIAANQKSMQDLLNNLEAARKLSLQNVVMGLFKAAGEYAAQVQVEINALDHEGPNHLGAQLTSECRKIRESYEADLARA